MPRKSAQRRGKAGARPPEGRRFQKGRSGNPGGRPKVPAEVKEAFRALTMDALKTLQDALSEGGPVAVKAAEVILDRGWGRATQAMEVTGKDGEPLPAGGVTGVIVLPALDPPPGKVIDVTPQPAQLPPAQTE